MKTQPDTLSVLRQEASALVRAEVRAGEQRAQLERAVRESIDLLGRTIDDVSEASGLTPSEIRRILDAPVELDDMAVLTGVA